MKKVNYDSNKAYTKILFRVLIISGLISSLLYLVTDIIASAKYEGYSYFAQCFSELQAIGAPTRVFIVILMSMYNLLVILFALGIKLTDKRKRACLMGWMMIGYSISGEVTTLLFPMHMRGVKGTISDTMHANLTYVFVLSTLLFIGLAATLYGKGFLIYSIVTILILILFGTLAGMDGSMMAANLPTPWLGVKERINIYASLLWIFILSVKTLNIYNEKNNLADYI